MTNTAEVKDTFTSALADLHPQLVVYARRRWKGVVDPDDLVQDVMVLALRFREQYRGESTLKTWVFEIIKKRVMDMLRRQRVREAISLDEMLHEPPSHMLSPEDTLISKEPWERVMKVLFELSAPMKMDMRKYLGSNHTPFSSTEKGRIHRAMKIVRVKLKINLGVNMVCKKCGSQFVGSQRQRAQMRKGGVVFCSKKCWGKIAKNLVE
ncbi:MAG: RNA polymerase sigma factor [Acidobacteriaceae bacterium]